MKTRQGFVSNSSSSSFIVAFPHMPESKEELQIMLFGTERVFEHPYPTSGVTREIFPAEEITAIVWEDLRQPLSEEEMREIASAGYLMTCPPHNYDEAGMKIADAHAVERVRKFIEKNPDHLFLRFSYADGDGHLASGMEHGNLFKNLPHITVSNH